MKHLAQGIITSRIELSESYFLLELECPKIAREAVPGQFIMLECKGETFLKRPMGLSSADPEKGVISFIYHVTGKGTRSLHSQLIGETIEVIGPLGNSFWKEKNARTIGLVAGGTGIGPLLMFGDWALKNSPETEIIGFIGAKNAKMICGEKEMKRFAKEVYCATNDGSFGYKGFVTDLLTEFLSKNSLESIIACGPTQMMKKTAEIASERNLQCQVSLEEHMACGFGACIGCIAEIKGQGYAMICAKGPVFDASEVVWKESNL